MVNIAIILKDSKTIELVENDFYNCSVYADLENPKCDFLRIGDNIFRKSEINHILVTRREVTR